MAEQGLTRVLVSAVGILTTTLAGGVGRGGGGGVGGGPVSVSATPPQRTLCAKDDQWT